MSTKLTKVSCIDAGADETNEKNVHVVVAVVVVVVVVVVGPIAVANNYIRPW